MDDETKRVEGEWSLAHYEGGLQAFCREIDELRKQATQLVRKTDNLQCRAAQMSELLERCKRYER